MVPKMIDKRLLAKIRKCLALARSDNEHEAAAALAKAAALMAEHGIDDATLALADIEEATARASRNQRPPKWETMLSSTVCRAFTCIVFINAEGDRTFIGRGARPEIAGYAFTVLYRQLKRARGDYIDSRLRRCKPGRKRQRADVFCEGWAAGCFNKIAAIVPEAEPDDVLERYLALTKPGLITIDSRSAKIAGKGAIDDWYNGLAKGKSAELNGGVGGASVALQLA